MTTMKLLVITSLKDYQKTVADILIKCRISVFSVSETIGFKDHHQVNLLDNWFSSGGDQFDSIFVFSFTSDENANSVMAEVKRYNENHDSGFPIRAFIMNVDQSSYTI